MPHSEQDAERQLLDTGRDVLRKLHVLAGDDPTRLAETLKHMAEANQGPALAAGLFAALVDHPDASHRDGHPGATALGVAAGLTGSSDGLYRAARLSRDVRAVERTMETGNPAYVERRIKNRIIGRALSRSGVWRKLWR
jgi:hypothetical protein